MFEQNNYYDENANHESISTTSDKLTKKFLDYQNKFKNNYGEIKSSLSLITDNIINYKSEIKKLEDFLIIINEHEKNYKLIQKKFEFLIKNLEETIDIEKIINQLSSNQQIINMSEYVNLYKRVKKIITYFKESKLQDKDDYTKNLNKMMYKGFKVYQDAFYVILKRYDQLNSNSTAEENEKLNLLNKIKNLSQCLQDEEINFDFTSNLIKEHSLKICIKIDDIKSSNIQNVSNKDTYAKGSGYGPKILQQTAFIFNNEEDYITEILSECDEKLKNKVLKGILEAPLNKIIQILKDICNEHSKYDSSNINSISYEFFHSLDILNCWDDSVSGIYESVVKVHQLSQFEEITKFIETIKVFCCDYVNNFLKGIGGLNNEKIENENVLSVTNNTIYFLSNLLNFETSSKSISERSKEDLSPQNFISTLVDKLESKSTVLDKKYPPLRYLLLMNNIYYIYSKIANKALALKFTQDYIDGLSKKIDEYLNEYLKLSWSKVDNITFDDKEVIAYESDGKTLKQTSKELIKKKFSTFNETMKINLKFQQHMQIIDHSLETKIINANIEYICKRYKEFYEKYGIVTFTRFRNKYIIYGNENEVEQDLKLYFMPDGGNYE